jgi:mono/diheme cytochrome c family protein
MLAVVTACTAGCEFPGKPDPKDRPVPPDKVLAFDTLFSRNCAGCHGQDGKFGPAPPLNDPLFRAIVSTDDLQMTISLGRPGTPMPAFAHANGGPLSPVQIQVLINEIKGTRYRIEQSGAKVDVSADDLGSVPTWGVINAAPDSVPAYDLPEKSGDGAQGAKVFTRACAGCHGENGQGIVLDDKRRNKINDQAFLALISDQALRRIIITGRPDFRMPTYAQKTKRPDDFQPLTSGQIDDLVALLASWRLGQTQPTKQ